MPIPVGLSTPTLAAEDSSMLIPAGQSTSTLAAKDSSTPTPAGRSTTRHGRKRNVQTKLGAKGSSKQAKKRSEMQGSKGLPASTTQYAVGTPMLRVISQTDAVICISTEETHVALNTVI